MFILVYFHDFSTPTQIFEPPTHVKNAFLCIKNNQLCHLILKMAFLYIFVLLTTNIAQAVACNLHVHDTQIFVLTKFKTQIFICKKNFDCISYQLQEFKNQNFQSSDLKSRFFRSKLTFVKNRFYHRILHPKCHHMRYISHICPIFGN